MATSMRLFPLVKNNNILSFFVREGRSEQLRFCSTSPRNNPNENAVGPSFYNRNPRNLEKLRIAYKPEGFWLEERGRNHWHRLYFEKSNRNVTGYVKHCSGKEVVCASTKEWNIKKQLYSTNDVSASINIGRVLAQRCLESGITEVYCEYTNKEVKSEKTKMFLKALEDGGMSLKEPPRYLPEYMGTLRKEEKPWEVTEDNLQPK